MEPIWNAKMLGGFVVQGKTRQIVRFRTQKTGSLLAYLLYFPEAHTRESLVNRFWPDNSLRAGRQSLSTALSSLRNQLEPPTVVPGSVIQADRTFIQINATVARTDTATFLQWINLSKKESREEKSLPYLQNALEVYTGQFMPGLYDDWIMNEGRYLHRLFSEATVLLLERLEKRNELFLAKEYTQRAIKLDPYNEDLISAMVRIQIAMGQIKSAKESYADFVELLDKDLGLSPTETLSTQIEALMRGAPVAVEQKPAPPQVDARHKLQRPSGTVTFLIAPSSGRPIGV